MKKHSKLVSIAAAVLLSGSAIMSAQQDDAKLFTFKYKQDDTYRILSTVQEDVYINNVPNHHSEIVSRIAIHVTGIDKDGNGIHEASFMTSDESRGGVTGTRLTWNEEYKSKYTKSPRGELTIEPEYFMPVVRDMPVFPDKPVKPGETWQHSGYEAHDLRRTFALEYPYLVPFDAVYTYEGQKTADGKTFDVITATYSLYFEAPEPENSPRTALYAEYPMTTMGVSKHTIYWDSSRGAIDHYDEEFRITLTTSYGNIYRFTGTTHSEITEFKRTATEENVQKLQEAVGRLQLQNVSVTKGDKGLTLSIENIQFKPDSAILQDSEKEKLRKIASLLKEFPDNDLLVSGHTALAGSAATRQTLSEQRAKAVADYLITLGVKDAYHIFTRGLGATVPIATNKTEEGKARNRRVEITIMDR